MDFLASLDAVLRRIASAEKGAGAILQRIGEEISFAQRFSGLYPEDREEWQGLILKAAERVADSLSADGYALLAEAVAEAEAILSPIGMRSKEYTIHCCGHAHIDMNWTWPWLETISMSHDTFLTVDRLMEAFPGFKFAQNQISVYAAMEEYCPEIFEIIRKRIREGRWDCTASMWTEGDKNMASGESLCRHLLYSKRYLKEHLGLPYDAVKLDWAGDTFGHAWTLPAILSRGGVTRYYHCRPGPGHWLAWWQAPDGSRILEFNDKGGYGGPVTPQMSHLMIDYVIETGLKDFLYIYGVSDHGGGPTRQHLIAAEELSSWPIFPAVKLSTTDDFFSAIEKADIGVHNGEINFVFEGCYTSQSKVKRVNRAAETILPEAEAIALVAGAATGFAYPAEELRRGWQHALFNQFHDILAGSSGHEAMEQAAARFQEIEAIAGVTRMRALRRLASQIDTGAASGIAPETGRGRDSFDDTIGFGAGDIRVPGGVSTLSLGTGEVDPLIVFNQMPFPRSEMVVTKVWNKDLPRDRILVRDDAGCETAGQVIGSSFYGEHRSVNILFPAKDVPAMGYRTYTVRRSASPLRGEGAAIVAPGVIENESLRIEIDIPSGAIRHLIDKSSGYDYVPDGKLMGVLEMHQEVPHGMTSWSQAEIERMTPMIDGGHSVDVSSPRDFLEGDTLGMVTSQRAACRGPHRASLKIMHTCNSSRITVEIGLSAGIPAVEITVAANWREVGTPEIGVPVLRMALPARLTGAKATYEIPFGAITRPANGQEVPALRWADLSGKRTDEKGACGITLVNDSKYGHSAQDSTLRLTLIRSSYDPDPLPETGRHDIRFRVIPHAGEVSISKAMQAASAFGLPMNVVTTDIHEGPLPQSKSFMEILTPNVSLAAMKKAEDSNRVVFRLYETEGLETLARMRIADIVKPDAPAIETDLLERPLETSTAAMEGDILSVKIPAYGIATVMVG